jgi:tetratricopeptide (TPR) repeat protein
MNFDIPEGMIISEKDGTGSTICFITMCKNEEHCIKETLESVYKYIDYWIVCDTGSTDNTCNIVNEFFKEKNIPGELFVDEWKGFDKNKTLMFERAYNKTDYVLHLDADDFFVGNFNKYLIDMDKKDKYLFNYTRGSSKFLATSLYNNRVRWMYLGVAHNIIKCLDKSNPTTSNILVTDDLYVDNNERGARKFDPNKYINDALKLKEQFFETLYEDPHDLNNRSIFYTAQSYMDAGYLKEAIQWYTLYTKLRENWSEELFESNVRIGRCMIGLQFDKEKIIRQFEKAIKIFPDRAEPYFILGVYLNQKSDCTLGYKYLREAKNKDLNEVLKKYVLFVNIYDYGKYVNDELSVACFWTNRGKEGFNLLNEIINDNEFTHIKKRLLKNKQHFIDRYDAEVLGI